MIGGASCCCFLPVWECLGSTALGSLSDLCVSGLGIGFVVKIALWCISFACSDPHTNIFLVVENVGGNLVKKQWDREWASKSETRQEVKLYFVLISLQALTNLKIAAYKTRCITQVGLVTDPAEISLTRVTPSARRHKYQTCLIRTDACPRGLITLLKFQHCTS